MKEETTVIFIDEETLLETELTEEEDSDEDERI